MTEKPLSLFFVFPSLKAIRTSEERLLKDLKVLRAENMELQHDIDDLRKTIEDKKQQINLEDIEVNSLRNQLTTMDNQYRDLLSENDRAKRESFNFKERLLAAESEIKALQMTLDKTQIHADQSAEALSRTERMLEV